MRKILHWIWLIFPWNFNSQRLDNFRKQLRDMNSDLLKHQTSTHSDMLEHIKSMIEVLNVRQDMLHREAMRAAGYDTVTWNIKDRKAVYEKETTKLDKIEKDINYLMDVVGQLEKKANHGSITLANVEKARKAVERVERLKKDFLL